MSAHTANSPRPLRFLGGRPATPQLATDVLLLLELSTEARDKLWSVLGPCLSENVPATFQRDAEAFERAFSVPPNVLPRILRACRVIVGAAALRGLDADALEADLRELTGNDEPGRILSRGYEAGRVLVRLEAMRGILLESGAVYAGVDWRVEHVGGTSRGDGLQFGYALVKIRYEEGGRQQHLTLQMTPEMVNELRLACSAILGMPPDAPARPRPAERPARD
jgi:hypothetical protein